jgi:hypothetical protein
MQLGLAYFGWYQPLQPESCESKAQCDCNAECAVIMLPLSAKTTPTFHMFDTYISISDAQLLC